MMRLFDKNIFEKYAEAFEALAEYDKTGKLPKLSYKKRIDITVDAKILRQIKEHCRRKGLKLSSLIEMHLKEELRKCLDCSGGSKSVSRDL